MKVKRILCMLLVLFVCAAAMSTKANAVDTYGDWEYSTVNGVVTIEGYNGSAAKVTVPSEIYGDPVRTIGYEAFENAYYLEEITFPETLRTIEGYAFNNCENLTSLTLPESLEVIEGRAFYGTRSLAKVTVKCKKLEMEDNGRIFENAGYDVDGGMEVVFTDTVTRVPSCMFSSNGVSYNCVTSVKIGKNVEEIGGSAFLNCKDLEKVTFSSGGVLEEIESEAFKYCESLKTLTLPASLNSIEDAAFSNCLDLTSLTLPEGLEELGDEAFYNARSLSKITVKSKKIEWLENRNTFYNAGYDSEDGIAVEFTNTAVSIPGNLFSTSVSSPACIRSVKIGKNVERIGPSALSNLPDLKTVTIAADSKLNRIDESAFADCSALKKINIPKSVEKIDNYAFKDCESLATVVLAGDPPTIGNKAFENVTAKVYYPKNNSDWDSTNMSDYGGTLSWIGANFASISKQPKTAYAKYGEVAETTVKAKGDGLKYQWYIKNAGASKYSKSSVKSATYSCEMSDKSKDRRAYCVITDKYGNSVQTKTVVLRMAASITKQPKNTYTQSGSTAKVTLKAMGDELTYTWYIKNAGASKYSKSSVKSATYSCKMSDASKDRYVYCVVEDEYGNTVKSKTVVLRMAATITKQPKSVIVEEGEKANVTVKAVGDGLTYEWYVSDVGDTKYYLSSIDTPTYSTKMNKAKDGRKAYCVITDKYGNSVKSNTVTLSME